ncbi:MAG: SusC/RagA family TonB-linked outer membrane protein [Candidatus Nephrothrix sp. EaCA]|nr:MAG: SusC/RagA family TonB-linked outer membrane protein [Candidatus Nephrothrix sp. EaCA]
MINFSTKVCPRRQCRGSCFFASMAMACLSIVFSAEKSSAQGDKILVRGTVIDETGGPLPGATVREKGTSNGVAADVEGEYKIRVSGSDAILIISSVGYVPKEETVGGRQEVNISLNEKVHELDEVVVVGFGEQRKISVVGAQSTISPEDLKMPVANVNQLLAGRISGVIGVQRSGEPGRSGADIWIRGLVFGGSSSPLVLVDGVERDLASLDPQDIASFSILKDAAGTAVYGVRGANGVVLVTTKKGRVGKPQIALDYSEGITGFVQVPRMADAQIYMEARNEALTTRGQKREYSDEYMQKTLSGEDPELYPNVDWMKSLFKDFGHVRRANMNVNGGSDFLKYYGSVSYYDESGLLNTDGIKKYNLDLRFRRFNVTTNVQMDVTKTTELEVGIRGYFTNYNRPFIGGEASFANALSTPPTEFPLEYTGGFVPGKSPNGGYRNPWTDLTRRGYTTEFQNTLNTNVQLTQKLDFLANGLKAMTMFSLDAFNAVGIERGFREPTYFPDANKPRNADGSLNLKRTFSGDGNYLGYHRWNWGNRRYYWQTSLNYDGKFGVHRVGGLALLYTDDYQDQFAGDFTSSIPKRYVGLAGRVTYSYDDRYLIEGNVGYNGSELFSPKNRYGAFPAIGVGWVISNEKFFAPLKKAVSYLKIRYTDGITGIGRIDAGRRFAYITLMNDNTEGYRFTRNLEHISGTRVTEYGSEVIWAKSHKQDLGVEFKLHEDHLSVIVDFFRDHRTGIFLQRETLPRYLGLVSNPWGNLGEFENKGIDGSMIYNNKIGKVEVSFRANATYNQDKILNNDQPKPKYEWMDRRGKNVLARFDYVAEKLFDSKEEIDKSAVPGDKSQVLPGDIKYQDLNEDGLINQYDQKQVGRGDVPYLVYGFGFNVGYKGFNLGAFFTGQRGSDIMLWGDGIRAFANGAGLTNVFANVTNRWQESNPSQNVFYPRLASGEDKNKNNSHTSTWWLRKADFTRLKTVELNYRFPPALLKNTFKAVTVYFQCFNPLTFTKFDLWDVESTINGGNGGRYPNIRSYNLGLLLNF